MHKKPFHVVALDANRSHTDRTDITLVLYWKNLL